MRNQSVKEPNSQASLVQIMSPQKSDILKGNGTTFLKYGRYGKPHKRQVYLNNEETRLVWKDSENGKEKHLRVQEIMSVMIGSDHTKVLKKHKIPVEFDNYCLSIITPKRTLDLRFDDQKVIQIWYEKLRAVITLNSESRLIRENQQTNLNRAKLNQLRDLLEALWREEILMNWQNYWSPLRR